MDLSEDRWAKFHEKALPYEEAIRQEPFKTLIETLVDFSKRHNIEIFFETGFGTGYSMVALYEALSGELEKQRWIPHLSIIGIDKSAGCRERFEKLVKDRKLDFAQPHGILATMNKVSDNIFDPKIYGDDNGVFVSSDHRLVYHQGLLEHFSDAKIRELLELQVKTSFAVIFSVPSFFYGRQDFGDERLLTIEQWQEILTSFDVLKLEYYDNKKHIVGILKGDFYVESE